MNTFKKTFIVISTLLLSASCKVMLNAMATDYSDPNGTPNVANTEWIAGYDYCRKKTNNSSIHIQNASANLIEVAIFGRATQNGNDESLMQGASNGMSTISVSHISIPGHSSRYIHLSGFNSNVYSYVHVYFMRANNNAYGYWSPDSYC